MQGEEKCWKERNAQRNSLCSEDQVDITRSNTWGRPYQSVDFMLCWVLGLLVRKAQHQASDSVPPEVAAGTPVSSRVLVRMEGHFYRMESRRSPSAGVGHPSQGDIQHFCSVISVQFSSVTQSCQILCDPMNCSTPGLPASPAPGAYLNSCPSSRWCHPTISSSAIPFSSCLQSFPASGSFPVSQFFITGDQSIGVSASASVLAMNIQDWSPLGWTDWISLQSKRFSRVFSNITVQKHQFFCAQLSL